MKDQDGISPLSKAVKLGLPQVVRILITPRFKVERSIVQEARDIADSLRADQVHPQLIQELTQSLIETLNRF
ncbi:hypothetical protein CIB48_g6690 [Xylaria polymorpha]|nr:hypothetical protein CIB48_g6690 [Xylaria polymorpha]